MLDETILQKMAEAAREAMTRAHAPVSSFPVGASLLSSKGNIYQGCNTESIIAGLGTCAERSAVDHAVIHGEKDYEAVLIVSRRLEPLFPCGACRQYLYEFAQSSGHDLMVYSMGSDGRLESALLSELLPRGFGPVDKRIA